MRLHLAPYILVLTLFTALPARADDPDGSMAAMAADLAHLTDCMAEADGSGDASRACTQSTAKACIKRLGDKASHAAEGACFYRESQIFQKLYRDRVMIGLNWANWNDNDELGMMRVDFHRLQIFMATETAWHSYAEAECKMEMLHWDIGNAGMVDQPLCMSRLYAERIALLDSLAKQQGWIRP